MGGNDLSVLVITNMLISRGYKVLLEEEISKLERVDECPLESRARLLANEKKEKLRWLRQLATPFWQYKNKNLLGKNKNLNTN